MPNAGADAAARPEAGRATHDYDGEAAPPSRGLARAMLRGALGRCPACGAGRLYRAFLKPADSCPGCGEDLHHQRADDAPPYVTIFFAGHLVVAAVVGVDIAFEWPLWLHAVVWFPFTVALCLGLLPMVKGALIGLQWALRMHGFGGPEDAAEAHPAAESASGYEESGRAASGGTGRAR